MQGYGRRRARFLAVPAFAAAALLAVAITSCGLNTSTTPSSIVLPPTDNLSTESDYPSSSTTIATQSRTATFLPTGTIGRAIATAPRADNSRYHQGSTTPRGPVIETSGFHFTSPDRAVSCSTEINVDASRRALACRSNDGQSSAPRPARTPRSCVWAEDLVVLTAERAQQGGCENEHPVLYRSAIVDYGTTISVGRFSCLIDTPGIFCLQSDSQSGFSLSSKGFAPLNAADKAPGSLSNSAGIESPIATTTEPEQPDNDTPASPTN